MLHLRDLAVMAAVVEEGSIQEAAVRLHRTPASISQTLKRLEDLLSLELFDRSSYRLRLNENGQAFFKQAQSVLGKATYLERYARLLARGHETSYRISVQPIVPDEIYLRAVCDAVAPFMETTLQISIDTTAGPFLRLQSGQVDLCIAASRQQGGEHQLGTESLLLGKVRTVNVTSTSAMPVGSDGDALLEWLVGVRQIVVSGTVDGDRGEFGTFEGDASWHVNSLEMKRSLILQGFGWGRLPEALVRQDLAAGRLTRLEVPGYLEAEEYSVWAFRRRDRPVGPVGEAVWRALSF